MAINETIGLTASFTTAGGKVLSKRANNVIINDTSNIVSTLELREGTFTAVSGGILTFANGSSTTFTPGIATTYNVAAAQAGVANFKGTSPTYNVRGSSLVKVLKYPNNATVICHWDSPNLIEVPEILPLNVTNLSSAFLNCTNFNHPNISKWNVSKVTDMTQVFLGATSFNQPLNNWNVGNVVTMYATFLNCTNFNQPLNNWNVGKVTGMSYMFNDCTNFSQDLSKWCVPLIASKPNGFNDNAPLLTAAKLPVWGTCPQLR